MMEYVYQILFLAQAAFTIWMLVDAYRRGVDYYWFFLILFFPVVGPWFYFFAVKAGDYQGLRLSSLFQPRVSLDELRFRAEQTPTVANHLALAERLVERHEHAEAIPHLEAVLKREPEHCQALYALALCHNEDGRPEEAVPLLERIRERDRCWSNYAAWQLLIAVHADMGDHQTAVLLGRDLVRLAPTLQHHCLLAEHLLEQGLNEEASDVLDRALTNYRYAPWQIRRRNGRWASVARKLQKKAAG